ncbi:helix-turn-helix domain-containing protein [Prochlorococcus sp. MIT 1307]|uniref:helix-turn-helix domain-containing protein n=1 Tax=Prochlorococcus sp. MIT 1307 TaxID=3096219 RepID=UPI002A74BD4E|nr:helix-turn-helix domain-containing protein [Prochlorococcus sp. MIT 1307]
MQDPPSIPNEPFPKLNPLQKIGGLIKKAREERNMSIEDLSGSLRIGQEQLIALENGEEELLPEKVFIKAMVRRVAERLHLELGALLNEFQIDNLSTPITPEIQQKSFLDLQGLKNIPRWALITGLIGITTSSLAINFLNNENSSHSIKKAPKPAKILAPKTKAIDSSYHIVEPGQTLSKISKFHAIPLKTLIQINELNNPDKLKVGAKLSLQVKKRSDSD